MKIIGKNLMLAFITIILAFFLAISHANALTLRFAHVAVQGSYLYKVGEKLKENIEKISNGEIEVKVFPAGQLGNLPQMMGQLKKGSIDLLKDHVGLTGIIEGGKDFFVIFAPYLFRDQAHLRKFMASSVFEDMMSKVEKANGIKSLGYIDSRAPRAISTRQKMVIVPDDLKGLKMRAPKVSAIPAIFKLWGASLAVVAAPEMYNALKQKVIDGQDNGIDIVADWKLYEVQKYFTAIDYSRAAECLWINQKKWDALRTSEQEAIKKATLATADWADGYFKDVTQNAYNLCRDEGMVVVMPPLKPWYSSSEKVIKELDGKIWPAGLYQKIHNLK